MLLQIAAQARQICAALLEHLDDPRNISDCQQQMLDRHEFMTAVPGLLECLIQAIFEFCAEHKC